jgi:acetyltransferase-like isoleucine patch superfamily enzyme
MLNKLLHYFASTKGLAGPLALQQWRTREGLSFLAMIAVRMLRGSMVRLRLKGAYGVVLCERYVHLYHPRHIAAGAWLNLEEGCEIVGLSKQGIVFGNRCTVGRLATIRPTNVLLDEPGEGLKMGDHSNIGAYSYIGCSGFIEIGNRVMMGPRVNLLAENHLFDRGDVPIKEQGVERKFIRVEDNCWIGASSTILAGVTLHEGAVIAAGSVVTKDVPSNTIVAGVPAKAVGPRVSASASCPE